MTRQNFSRETVSHVGFFSINSNFDVSYTVVKLSNEFTRNFRSSKLAGRTARIMFHVQNQLVGSPSCDASNRTQLAWERRQMLPPHAHITLAFYLALPAEQSFRVFALLRTLSLAVLDRRSTWNLALAVIKIYEL